MAMPLPHLEGYLLGGHIVAAMAVEQQDPREAMKEHGLHEPIDQIEIGPRGSRERAGKVQVVVRVAEPLQRRDQQLP
jgi:hypothetical protein